MNRIVIFNVGGAFSSYAELDGQKILIDLGSGNNFSPINDFLIKVATRNNFPRFPNTHSSGKFHLDQVFMSHLDKDHISDYINFREYFYSSLLTCPNDNSDQFDIFKVNRSLLGEDYEVRNMILEDMRRRSTRDPKYPDLSQSKPLISGNRLIGLYFNTPHDCEVNVDLKSSYQNNISLALYISNGKYSMFIPGDLLKSGMEYLLNKDSVLKHILEKYGVDLLVAPHHGLQTSFSQALFDTIKGNKTRLNIISEKVRSANSDETRSDVDSRYYSNSYSSGQNSLHQNAVKTSGGHIVINFDETDITVKVIDDNDKLVEEFS